MADINAQVLAFAQRQSGRYRDGECWTLVEDSIVRSGGVSSRTQTPRFGTQSDYIWGTLVTLGALRPGDVLQFRNYSWRTVTNTRITQSNGDWDTSSSTETRGRSHHSAIVVQVLNSGGVNVIEQNIPAGSGAVQTVALLFSAGPPRTTRTTDALTGAVVETTVTDTVTNPPRAYRPKT